MRNVHHTIPLLLFVFSCTLPVARLQAQPEQKYLRQIRVAAAAFTDTAYQHFDICYRYASAETPGRFEDSLTAGFKTWRNRFWYTASNTEVVSDDSLAVVLFKDDQLIYLTRPGQANALSGQFALLDSLLGGKYPVAVSAEKQGSVMHYRVEFIQPVYYKIFECWINEKGRILKTRQLVNRMLAEQQFSAATQPGSAWISIELEFRQYPGNDFRPEWFDTRRVVTKENNEWVARSPYQHFTVFKANPKL